ncbi:hypothetical protein HDV05_004712 [Chytridiales sp. JEL 0842]|nr:hypothetical protein HDV05_004712 [Chytridiales sp. JEL 0842]
MASAATRTFLGFKVWPANILKVYWPFMVSGSLAYFLFGSAATAMLNEPTSKWANISNNVKEESKKQVLKTEAANWLEEEKSSEASEYFSNFRNSLAPKRPSNSIRVIWFTSGLGTHYLESALNFAKSLKLRFCSPSNIVQTEMVIFTNRKEFIEPKNDKKNKKFWSKVEKWKPNGREDIPDFVRFIYAEKKGWPHDTKVRFQLIKENARRVGLEAAQFAFWTDADQLIHKPFCFDVLGKRVGVMHPHVWGDGHPFEKRPESAAYIPGNHSTILPYFSAHLFGGSGPELFRMVTTLSKQVATDRVNNIQAIVDDESHLNRYFYDHQPTVILSRGFVYPEHKLREEEQYELMKNVEPFILAVGMPEGARETE